MCALVSGSHSSALCDRRTHETQHLIVVPARGWLMPGHLLIVSKEHVPSFGACSQEVLAEAEELIDRIGRRLHAEFGRATFFENGARSPASSGGSSMLHAHIHVAPAPTAFATDARKARHLRPAASLSDTVSYFTDQRVYLYLEEHRGRCLIGSAGERVPR